MNGILVDTNVLLCAHDRSDPSKQARAFDVLTRLGERQLGCLSVQNLAEFASIATRQQRNLLTLEEASRSVSRWLQAWPIHDLTPVIIREALHGAQRHRLNYWDAQVWATARIHRIPTVFSEDFHDGSRLDGVRFVNPFATAFRLGDWT